MLSLLLHCRQRKTPETPGDQSEARDGGREAEHHRPHCPPSLRPAPRRPKPSFDVCKEFPPIIIKKILTCSVVRLGSPRTLSLWQPPSTPRPCLSPTSPTTPPSHSRWSCSLTSRRRWDSSISTFTGKSFPNNNIYLKRIDLYRFMQN